MLDSGVQGGKIRETDVIENYCFILLFLFFLFFYENPVRESGSRGDFLRRFRICGQNLRIQASRRQNLGKTTSKIDVLIRFSSV